MLRAAGFDVAVNGAEIAPCAPPLTADVFAPRGVAAVATGARAGAGTPSIPSSRNCST